MAYLIGLGSCIAGMLAVLLWVAKLALSPREIYRKGPSTAFGPTMHCRHCDAVVTRRNLHEHGVNCAKRPHERGKPS